MNIRHLIFVCFSALMLTAVSCNKPSDGSNDLIFMWFEVSGKVVNEEGTPVAGISVYAESADPVKTDSDGMFLVNGGGAPAESTVLRFIDEDNEGVKYTPRIVTVPLEKYKDGQGWTEGYYRNSEAVVVSMTEDVEVTLPNTGTGSGQGEEQ